MSTSPSYHELAEQLRQAALPYEPAELQGVLCGALAQASAPSAAALLAKLAEPAGDDLATAA